MISFHFNIFGTTIVHSNKQNFNLDYEIFDSYIFSTIIQ